MATRKNTPKNAPKQQTQKQVQWTEIVQTHQCYGGLDNFVVGRFVPTYGADTIRKLLALPYAEVVAKLVPALAAIPPQLAHGLACGPIVAEFRDHAAECPALPNIVAALANAVGVSDPIGTPPKWSYNAAKGIGRATSKAAPLPGMPDLI